MHLATATRYGIFRDEPYYIACPRHLDFRYVDHPLLIADISWLVLHLFGAVRQALFCDGLVHHSTHDHLTNLSNRRLCETRLALVIDQAAKDDNCIAVIYVDVNRSKQVNDQFGHKLGDYYLRLISQRFLAQTRPCDTVARIGGDEFSVIVPVGNEAEGAEEIVARLRSCFNSPFRCDEARIDGSASFGAVVYPYDGTTAKDLKRNADYAMYVAKKTKLDNAAVIGVEG